MKKFAAAALAAFSIMTITTNDAQGRENPLVGYFNNPSNPAVAVGLPFDKITSADYEDAIRQGMADQNREIEAIVNQRSVPTFENTIAALDRSGKLLTGAELALGNVEHATGDTVLQKMQARLAPELARHYSSVMLNEGLRRKCPGLKHNTEA